MIDEGHEVAIHHHRHVSAWTQTPWQLKRQIHQCAQVIKKVTNQKPHFYRPPWGHLNMSRFINGQAISPCDLDRNLSGLDTKNNENGIGSKTNA